MPASAVLITAPELQRLLAGPTPPVLLDCSFDLADPQAGERAFEAAHLPGAQYAHLDRDLSGPKTAAGPINGGRHPLPAREAFAARVARWGIHPGRSVVCYDNQGSPYAARAWWMLRWLGHSDVRVLDGGMPAWLSAGGACAAGADAAPAQDAALAPYPLGSATMPTVQAAVLLGSLGAVTVLDARAAERFRGEVEPLDSQAGHIPGASNRFFKGNLQADGCFLPAELLRAAFEAICDSPATVVHQCGSGVTACHNLLAMEHAGLHGSSLYAGSWSEWSADPQRPVARG